MIRPGFWMVRCCQHCPEIAARVFLCDHEPGLPDNKVDQPYLQGQLGLDLVDPHEIAEMVEFVEAPLAERSRMIAPPLSARAPKGNRERAFATAPMAKWKTERARRISEAQWCQQIVWLRWAEKYRPDDPALNYRRPIDRSRTPLPLFGSTAA